MASPSQTWSPRCWSHHVVVLLVVFFLLVAFPLAKSTVVTPAVGRGTLVQVQVVVRHGARTPLTKQAKALLEGGSTLTAIGELEQYRLGRWLRDRYATVLDIEQYDSGTVHLQSSDFDRTLASASSLARGLFPHPARDPIRGQGASLLPSGVSPANVPVHSIKRSNDIDIRGYSNCPLIQERLEALYTSDDFKAMQLDNIALLTKLAKRVSFSAFREGMIVPLRELWNVYDSINVAKTECAANVTAPACQGLPDPSVRDFLSAEEWDQTVALAHAAEHLKFGRNTTQALVGGNLLRTVAMRMGSTPRGDTNNDRRLSLQVPREPQSKSRSLSSLPRDDLDKFVLYSGHYPTILGIFASLDLLTMNPTAAVARESIPNYASAFIFELWKTAKGNYEVVAAFKDGAAQTGEPSPIALPCEGSTAISGGMTSIPCSLESFAEAIHSFAGEAYDSQSWCKICNNTESDVCTAHELVLQAEQCVRTTTSTAAITGVISMFVGAGIGALLASWCITRARQRSQYQPGAGGSDNRRAVSRREVAMGMRHGSKRADAMERLSDEEDSDEDLDSRI